MLNIEEMMSAEHLMDLKKGDSIWVAQQKPLFKTYDAYLGYDSGDEDAEYDNSMYVIKGTSPDIWAPQEMKFVSKIINGECKDDVGYVFCADIYEFELGDFRFEQYVVRPYPHFRGYMCKDFYLNALQFACDMQLSMKDVFLSEKDCFKECRRRNNMPNSLRYIACIKKTLSSLQTQFDEFMKSDAMVDAKEQIEKDLNGR